MKPLGKLILVKKIEEEQKGLILVNDVSPVKKACVLAINAEEKDISLGDIVFILDKGTLTKEGLLIHKNDILAIVE